MADANTWLAPLPLSSLAKEWARRPKTSAMESAWRSPEQHVAPPPAWVLPVMSYSSRTVDQPPKSETSSPEAWKSAAVALPGERHGKQQRGHSARKIR